jgi:hypothetical protein
MEKEVEMFCCKRNQQNQVQDHHCKDMENFLRRHIVSTASAICGVKPEHSRQMLRICHVIQIFSVSEGVPDRRDVQTWLADWFGYECHMSRFLVHVFYIPALTFNFQHPSIIPGYSITLFIGMLG